MFFVIVLVSAEELELHHLGMGQGDATLIVAKHKDNQYTTILIDTSNSSGKGKAIFKYMDSILGSKYKRLDVLVVSHLHTDHYGGAAALLTLMQDNLWEVGVIIDKDKIDFPSFDGTYVPLDACYDHRDVYFDNDPIQEDEFGVFGAVFDKYKNKVDEFPQEKLKLGADLFQLVKKVDTDISMKCLATNVKVLTKWGSKSHVDKSEKARSENDYSYAFLLKYQGFTYFSGGDLGGYAPAYLDLETPLINYFRTIPTQGDFHVCVAKSSHHGSRHSTNETFAEFTNPTMTVIQSALRSYSGTQIPERETFETLEEIDSRIELTYIPEDAMQPWQGAVDLYRDVVIKVKNPGLQKDVFITVKAQLRDKKDLKLIGDAESVTVRCDKDHGF